MAGSQTTNLDLVGLLTRATLYTNLFGVSPKWLRLKLFSVLWLFRDNKYRSRICKHKNLYNRSLFI